jgi:hypothetical protein
MLQKPDVDCPEPLRSSLKPASVGSSDDLAPASRLVQTWLSTSKERVNVVGEGRGSLKMTTVDIAETMGLSQTEASADTTNNEIITNAIVQIQRFLVPFTHPSTGSERKKLETMVVHG